MLKVKKKNDGPKPKSGESGLGKGDLDVTRNGGDQVGLHLYDIFFLLLKKKKAAA